MCILCNLLRQKTLTGRPSELLQRKLHAGRKPAACELDVNGLKTVKNVNYIETEN